MKALIINPEIQCIVIARFDADGLGNHLNVLRELIGESFQFEHNFANGDYLYTADKSEDDRFNTAFEMDGITDLLYGRAAIVSFDAHNGALKNPATTLDDLQSKIYFYTFEETMLLRSGEWLRQLGCTKQ